MTLRSVTRGEGAVPSRGEVAEIIKLGDDDLSSRSSWVGDKERGEMLVGVSGAESWALLEHVSVEHGSRGEDS